MLVSAYTQLKKASQTVLLIKADFIGKYQTLLMN